MFQDLLLGGANIESRAERDTKLLKRTSYNNFEYNLTSLHLAASAGHLEVVNVSILKSLGTLCLQLYMYAGVLTCILLTNSGIQNFGASQTAASRLGRRGGFQRSVVFTNTVDACIC